MPLTPDSLREAMRIAIHPSGASIHCGSFDKFKSELERLQGSKIPEPVERYFAGIAVVESPFIPPNQVLFTRGDGEILVINFEV